MRSLTLSGWTQPSDALLPLVGDAAIAFDYSEYASPEASFEALRAFQDIPHVVAWSMGGQLALRAIAAGVLCPAHLTLIAPPIQFVADKSTAPDASEEAVAAMDPLTFTQFRNNYAAQPARTKNRFHALVAKGDRDFTRILSRLEHHPRVEDTARWLPWLDDLGAYTLTEAVLARIPPTLIVHGTHDAIVPHAQGAWLAERLPQAQLNSWHEVGHAPHVHDMDRLRNEIAIHRQISKIAA